VKIGVCIKSTPDTEARITVRGGGDGIDPTGIKYIISPYDVFGLEEGVQAKEKLGGEVVLYTVGDASAQKNLRDGLALGADRAVHINDPAIVNSDPLATARALAAAIKADGMEIAFCGIKAADDDNVQVPGMLAECLGWPQVTFVKGFETDGTAFTATRNVGGGVEEVVKGNLPVVISADRGLNEPRYAKLPSIMKAKRKPLATKDAAALGLSADDIAPSVQISNYAPPPARPKGRLIDGDTVEAKVNELVRLLRDEAKVL
jgi:electron transfer flavoprotein beta subunit